MYHVPTIAAAYQLWLDGAIGFADYDMATMPTLPTLDTIVIADVNGEEIRFPLRDMIAH